MKTAFDTSLPVSTRVAVIVQITLVFWIMLALSIKPFMTQYYLDRMIEQLSDNQALVASSSEGMLSVLSTASRLLVIDMPRLLQCWLGLSFLVCLFLLLRVDGAQAAAWLLCLLAVLCVIDNWRHGLDPLPAADAHLFPSEQVLLTDYLHEQPVSGVLAQRQQLKRGFDVFLQSQYGGDLATAQERFRRARLEAWRSASVPDLRSQLRERVSFWCWLPFLSWHVFFASFVNRRGALEFSCVTSH